MAVTPDGAQVWVINGSSDSVSVIDTATNTVIGSPIAVGGFPIGIALSPDGASAWVINYDENSISVIDTSTRTVTATIPSTEGLFLPRQLAFSPDGSEVWVTNNGTAQVLVFSTTSRLRTRTIAAGLSPLPLAFSPDGSRVWVGNSVGRQVVVINARTYSAIGSPIPVRGDPFGIAVSADGSTVWVATNTAPTLTRIDAATSSVQGTVNVGPIPYGVAVSSGSGLVWVSDVLDNQVVAVDPTTMTVVERVAVGIQPGLIALSPNQQFLYVPNKSSDTVSVVRVADPISGPPASFAALAAFSFHLPDGRECSAISPVLVEVGSMFTLPGVDANCRTMAGSTLLGWTIPVPAGFTGFGSSASPYPPGLPVKVIESQRFTAVLFDPVLTFHYDANVALADTCVVAGVADTRGRIADVWVPRVDATRARFPTAAACTPPGHTLVGWNTRGDGSGTTYQPGATFPAEWSKAGTNNRTLFAMWRAR